MNMMSDKQINFANYLFMRAKRREHTSKLRFLEDDFFLKNRVELQDKLSMDNGNTLIKLFVWIASHAFEYRSARRTAKKTLVRSEEVIELLENKGIEIQKTSD